MSWATIDPELRAIAERVCTERELEALKLKAAGYGLRRMGLALGIDPSTARDRLRRAQRKIQEEVAAMRGLG